MKKMQDDGKATQTSVIPDMLAYSGTALATLATMWVTTREALYGNLKKMAFFKEAEDVRNNGLKELTEKATAKPIATISNSDFHAGIKKYNKDYAKATEDLLKKSGFTNSWKKFKHLNFSQQAGIVITGTGLATVAVGAIISIRHQREIARDLRNMNSKQTAPQGFADKEKTRQDNQQAGIGQGG
jgi:hypothetical protein